MLHAVSNLRTHAHTGRDTCKSADGCTIRRGMSPHMDPSKAAILSSIPLRAALDLAMAVPPCVRRHRTLEGLTGCKVSTLVIRIRVCTESRMHSHVEMLATPHQRATRMSKPGQSSKVRLCDLGRYTLLGQIAYSALEVWQVPRISLLVGQCATPAPRAAISSTSSSSR